jgi:hypothetical protein
MKQIEALNVMTGRDAVLIHHEASAPPDFFAHLFVRETFDTDDLHLSLPRELFLYRPPNVLDVAAIPVNRATSDETE